MRLLLFLPCRTGQPAGLPDCSGEALRWLYTTEKWCYRLTLVSPFSVTQLTVSRVLTCRPGYSAAHNTQPVSPACRRAVGSTPASSPWGGGRRAGAPTAAGPAPASGRPGHPQPEQVLQCHPGNTSNLFIAVLASARLLLYDLLEQGEGDGAGHRGVHLASGSVHSNQ